SSAQPGEGIYDANATALTYERLLGLAQLALDAGYPTIVDATFLRAHERDAFRRAAESRKVPFSILHCHADPALLRERVAARHAARADASDADLAVLERQLAGHDALRDDERAFAIDADTGHALDVDAVALRWLGASRAPVTGSGQASAQTRAAPGAS
ncbi:MAG: ATP-binding protein, partial [Burkholderiales bacterium]